MNNTFSTFQESKRGGLTGLARTVPMPKQYLLRTISLRTGIIHPKKYRLRAVGSLALPACPDVANRNTHR